MAHPTHAQGNKRTLELNTSKARKHSSTWTECVWYDHRLYLRTGECEANYRKWLPSNSNHMKSSQSPTKSMHPWQHLCVFSNIPRSGMIWLAGHIRTRPSIVFKTWKSCKNTGPRGLELHVSDIGYVYAFWRTHTKRAQERLDSWSNS